MIYELREYTAVPGAVERLHARFENTVLPLFGRHGIEIIGLWTDDSDADGLVYLIRYPDEETRDAVWKTFSADNDWQQAKVTTEAAGPIVAELKIRRLRNAAYWPHETARA
jgi:hypothetical protein